MAVRGDSTVLLVAGNDLTTKFKSIDVGRSAKELDSTTFGGDAATGDQTFTPGLKMGKCSATGYWEQGTGYVDTTSLDTKLAALLSAASQPVTVGWQGTAIGNRAALFGATEAEWTIAGKVADLVGVNIELPATDGAVDFGVWLANLAARGTGTNVTLTSYDFGAASTTSNGFAATIHLPSYTGTFTLNAKIQDSADNSTFADVTGGAFTALTTATGSQLLVGTASVRRYVRVMYTISGASPSPTFAIAFAKR